MCYLSMLKDVNVFPATIAMTAGVHVTLAGATNLVYYC